MSPLSCCILNSYFCFYFLFLFQVQKLDNNSKIGRPPGTGPKGSAPAGPNSGRKWVHRSVEVGASTGAGAGASESNSDARQSTIVGKICLNLLYYVILYSAVFSTQLSLFNPFECICVFCITDYFFVYLPGCVLHPNIIILISLAW